VKYPLVSRILLKVARRAGVKIELEPAWKFTGRIIFPNGRKMYFRNTCFDLNGMGASEIAKDKDYANYFLRSLGYPTIPGQAFYSPRWAKVVKSKRTPAAAYKYARRLGLPVIVKPNSRSQGLGVVKVYTRKEFDRAVRAILKWDKIFLVQRPVGGRDYRIVVLDNEIISAYERLPLAVRGDGRRSIGQLLRDLQKQFVREERDTQIKVHDFRIRDHLRRQKLSLRSVPPPGKEVTLLDNRNLSTGGSAVDVTAQIHAGFRDIAVALARDMGLRYCGVDLMVEGSLSEAPGIYWVIEVNSAAGLDHYAAVGRKQEKIVENLYLKVLLAMKRMAESESRTEFIILPGVPDRIDDQPTAGRGRER